MPWGTGTPSCSPPPRVVTVNVTALVYGQSPSPSCRGLPALQWGQTPLFAYRGPRHPALRQGRVLPGQQGLAGIRCGALHGSACQGCPHHVPLVGGCPTGTLSSSLYPLLPRLQLAVTRTQVRPPRVQAFPLGVNSRTDQTDIDSSDGALGFLFVCILYG